MKASERQHLKQNLFRERALAIATSLMENRARFISVVVGVVVVAAAIGAYGYWNRSLREAGGTQLGAAMSIAQAPIVPAPTLPGATQVAGTYPTIEARNQAALTAFQQVATEYPTTAPGRAAAYHGAATLLLMGRAAEAEAAFGAALTAVGDTLYGPMCRMGRAEAQVALGKFDEAITALTTLAADRDGILPVDGVLMQLGRASLKAEKTSEARAAFKRVVDEFPESPYAAEARQQLTLLG